IIGPPISVGLSVAVFPEAGPLVAALLLAVGVTTFVLQRQTEPPVHAHQGAHGRWLIASPSVLILMILLLAMGVIVGVVDVVSVAFAQHQGQPAAASIVLSVYAIGSCLAGLAFGALKLKAPLPRQFLYCGVATALTTLPLLLVSNIPGLAAAIFISGLFFAPTLIVSMAMVEQIVPASRLTEGMTWLITGLSIGVAIGAASSGWMIDHFGATSGFWVALAAGTVVAGSAVLGYRRLG
ncbi:MFS transporter, partial [Pseudomonas fluorescens]